MLTTQNTPETSKFAVVREQFSEDQCRALIDEVVRDKSRLPLPVRKVAEQFVQSVKCRGFRPGKAPRPQIVHELVHGWENTCELAVFYLNAWAFLHPETIRRVLALVEDRLPGIDAVPGDPAADLARLLAEAVPACRAAGLAESDDEMRLALLALWLLGPPDEGVTDAGGAADLTGGRAIDEEVRVDPPDAEGLEGAGAPAPGVAGTWCEPWAKCLETLQVLPPDAPAWQQYEPFMVAVGELLRDRQEASARADHLQQLAHRFAEMLVTHAGLIEYCEIADMADWEVSTCDADRYAMVLQEIELLETAFIQYREVDRSGAGMRARREAEDAVLARYRELQRHFPPPTPDGPDTLAGSEPPTPEGASDAPVEGDTAIGDDIRLTEDDGGSEEACAPADEEPANDPAPDHTPSPVLPEELPAGAAGFDVAPVMEETAPATAREKISAVETVAGEADRRDRASERVTCEPPAPVPPPAPVAGVWQLLARGDLAGAYWAATVEEQPATSPRVLKTLVAGHLLQDLSRGALYEEALNELSEHLLAEDDPAAVMLGVAASVQIALSPFESTFLPWLRFSTHIPELDRLQEALEHCLQHGAGMLPGPLNGDTEGDDYLPSIYAERTKKWLEAERGAHFNFSPANDTWNRLLKADGEWCTVFSAALGNEIRAWRGISDRLDHDWKLPRDLEDRVQSIHRQRDTRLPPISGPILNSMLRKLQEGVQLVRAWCECAARTVEDDRKGITHASEQLAASRAALVETLPKALTALATVVENGPVERQTAAIMLCSALQLLSARLQGAPAFAGPILPDLPNDWWVQGFPSVIDTPNIDMAYTIDDILHRRLFLEPGPVLDTSGRFRPDTLPDTVHRIIATPWRDRAIEDRMRDWMEIGDYRWLPALVALLTDDDARMAARSEILVQHEEAQRRLRQERDACLDMVMQGFNNGVFADRQLAEYQARLEAMDPEHTACFSPHFDGCREIAGHYQEVIEQEQQKQELIWQQLLTEVRPHLASPAIAHLESLWAPWDTASDLSLRAELLADVRSIVRKGAYQELEQLHRRTTPTPDVYDRFLAAAPGLQTACVQRNGDLAAILDAWQAESGQPLPAHALDGLKRWTALKGEFGPRSEDRRMRDCMQAVLQWLGFALNPLRFRDENAPGVSLNANLFWHRLAVIPVRTSEESLPPIPHFGSKIGDLYPVLCAGGDFTPEMLNRFAQQEEWRGQSLVVLVFGALDLRQRLHFARIARQHRLALVLLDETLLLHLCTVTTPLLDTLLRCALPFSQVNPYVTSNLEELFPEMFFGRHDYIERLIAPNGSCILYGGRKLGKTALMKHVIYQFTDRKQDKYSWREELGNVWATADSEKAEAIWRLLLEGFIREGLVKSTTARLDDVVKRQILQAFEENPRLHVLIMLDEADYFLVTDAHKQFPVLRGLRELMENTGFRLKLIFAGLHHVQRFQSISNQPFADFEQPICLGPLKPDEARQLITQPMEALGIHIDDPNVRRIMLHTRNHPGLIQKICYELVDMAQKRLQLHAAAYSITPDDVNRAYRARQEDICQTFTLTLELYPPYKVIVFAMVYEQFKDHDSFAREFSVSEIKALAESWWRECFAGMESYEFIALLKELDGLGVLDHTDSRRYYLRSPNMVRLLGTASDIEMNLLELSERAYLPEADIEYFHVPIAEVQPPRYSPITIKQARELLGQFDQFTDIGLIFGTPVHGLGETETELSALYPGKFARSVIAVHTVPPQALADMDVWMRKTIESSDESLHIMCVRVPVPGQPLYQVIDAARVACDRLADFTVERKVSLCCQLIGDLAAAWDWLLLAPADRQKYENLVYPVLYLQRWTLAGIRQRLEMEERRSSDTICHAIMAATGGWPLLLDALFDRSEREVSLLKPAESWQAHPCGGDEALTRDFLSRLGLDTSPVVRKLLECVGSYGWMKQDDYTPSFLAGELQVDASVCEAAIAIANSFGFVEHRPQAGDDQAMFVLEPILKRVLMP